MYKKILVSSRYATGQFNTTVNKKVQARAFMIVPMPFTSFTGSE